VGEACNKNSNNNNNNKPATKMFVTFFHVSAGNNPRIHFEAISSSIIIFFCLLSNANTKLGNKHFEVRERDRKRKIIARVNFSSESHFIHNFLCEGRLNNIYYLKGRGNVGLWGHLYFLQISIVFCQTSNKYF